MKLSIIIVSYNEANYIRESIDSCINQKGNIPIEIIIGDDGSNDGSIDIIKEYQTKYPEIIKYFVMERPNTTDIIPSIRVSNIIKRAFSISTGNYFMVMSGDDLLIDEYKTSKQVEFLEQNQNYISCYTDFKKFWNDGKEIECSSNTNISRRSFWSFKYVHISCFVFKDKVLEFLLEDFCDDTGLLFSILLAGKTRAIQGMSFAYRQRDASIMHEADKLELSIIELLLFNDVIQKNAFTNSSLSRFTLHINYVFKHRQELQLDKYKKYINFSCKYDYNILEKIINYDQLTKKEKKNFDNYIKKTQFLRFMFTIIVKLEMLLKKFYKW